MPFGDLIRQRGTDRTSRDRAFVLFNDERVSFAAYHAECVRWANLLLTLRKVSVPFHVGVLLDNTPDYLYAFGGAALAGATLVGINNTKRGEHLARDITHTDCQILVTEEKYLPLLDPIGGQLGVARERFLVSHRWSDASNPPTLEPSNPHGTDLDAALAQHGGGGDPNIGVSDKDTCVLIFTSGTVSAPKAVICSHGRAVETGKNIGSNMYGLTPADVGYLAMPLFHSNAMMCGYFPALYYGCGLGLIRKFSKTQWLADIRRYGVTFFNYTGKPLAYILTTARQPDDHVNPLRICFGNEGSNATVQEFAERFDCRVIDTFGSTEGGAGVTRQPDDPPGSIGMPAPGILIVDEDSQQRPAAQFDGAGRLLNPDEAIGEIVNTLGTGWFEGYYQNDDAMRARTRNGWYWTGDLGYRDERGYLYFAGRDVDWIRVDGENFPGRPIEEILLRHPAIALAAVYGVPDAQAGDRVMAAVILRDGYTFDSVEFAAFLARQPDLSPKWVPTYLRVCQSWPETGTNKVLKRELQRQKFDLDAFADPVYWRSPGDARFRLFGRTDYGEIRAAFVASGSSARLDV
ncbi:MAG: AMP-binding protein [Deltaproteobacteria bacterium]|nr:AMP-binding protein [Deltaproteobacteria bacterium]MBI3390900.1 AMP-binding protein [Deltaproteobacteria bacterium]